MQEIETRDKVLLLKLHIKCKMALIVRCLVPVLVLSAPVHITWVNPLDATQFGLPENFTAEFKHFDDVICERIKGNVVCAEKKVVGIEYVPHDLQNASYVPMRR